MLFNLIGLLGLFLASPVLALAYIDPGTGATVIGSLGPLLIGIVIALTIVLLKIFWKPLMRRLRGGKDEDDE